MLARGGDWDCADKWIVFTKCSGAIHNSLMRISVVILAIYLEKENLNGIWTIYVLYFSYNKSISHITTLWFIYIYLYDIFLFTSALYLKNINAGLFFLMEYF